MVWVESGCLNQVDRRNHTIVLYAVTNVGHNLLQVLLYLIRRDGLSHIDDKDIVAEGIAHLYGCGIVEFLLGNCQRIAWQGGKCNDGKRIFCVESSFVQKLFYHLWRA